MSLFIYVHRLLQVLIKLANTFLYKSTSFAISNEERPGPLKKKRNPEKFILYFSTKKFLNNFMKNKNL